MKFIAKHLNLIGLLLLTAFAATAAGLYFDLPIRKAESNSPLSTATAKPEITTCEHGPGEVASHAGCGPAEQTAPGGCCPKPTPAPDATAAGACTRLQGQQPAAIVE